MSADALKLIGAAMVCDACGHEHLVQGRPTESMIGTPCPACTADMLTREDFDAAMTTFAILDAVNAFLGPVENPKRNGPVISVNPHGGALNIAVNVPPLEAA